MLSLSPAEDAVSFQITGWREKRRIPDSFPVAEGKEATTENLPSLLSSKLMNTLEKGQNPTVS